MNYEKLKSFYSGKRVFLTGHTGFKGSWLCVILKMLGAEVYGYSLKPNTDPDLFDILVMPVIFITQLVIKGYGCAREGI